MEEKTPPPSKRLRSLASERALKFALSPQSIPSGEAIDLRQKDPNLSLRWTSTQELSPSKASKENVKPGFALSLWPSPTGATNKAHSDLLKVKEEILLYFHLLQTSLVTCIGDAISFVLGFLDHCLRKVACEVEHFEEVFVGEYKSKPFQTDTAENICYLTLLKFIGYLQKAIEKEASTSKKAFDKEASTSNEDSNALLQSCLALQDASEAKLMDLLQSLGAKIANRQLFASQLRRDLIVYRNLESLYSIESLQGTKKDTRNAAAHPFTFLLWTQYKTPLAKLEGLDKDFPQPFHKMLKHDVLGKVALLLTDMEKKFEDGGLGDMYATVLPAAFFLIREFMKSNNENARDVKWYDMRATIPGKKNAVMPPLELGGSASGGGFTRSAANTSFVTYPEKP